MQWDKLKRDWRMWLLVLSLVVSILLVVSFNPLNPYRTVDGKTRLDVNISIKQGLDLAGGARVLIEPMPKDGDLSDSEMEEMISRLKTRVSAFGLQEMDIAPVIVQGEKTEKLIQVELAGANTSDLTTLLNKTGVFEARIPFTVRDGTSFTLGSESYTAELNGSTLRVGDNTAHVNETFNLSSGDRSISVTYNSFNESGAVLSPLAFTGQDVMGVDVNPRVSGYQDRGDVWSFKFQVSITENGAQRFRDVAKVFEKGVRYLRNPVTGNNAKIVFYLDDSRISALNIRNSFHDSLVQRPVVTGSAPTKEEAIDENNRLQSVLESGALPVPIRIQRTTRVSATLGQHFLSTALTAIILAIFAVSLVVFVRYRDPRIVIPLTLTGFSELVIIFGFAAAVNWTIDLPSIAGIIAAVGTGVDDQIIITDERGRRDMRSLKKRLKRAFFIIFTSAASTIGAMLPLTKIGAGEITGFAVTTIAGVLIGVGITRPAYARVLRYMED